MKKSRALYYAKESLKRAVDIAAKEQLSDNECMARYGFFLRDIMDALRVIEALEIVAEAES